MENNSAENSKKNLSVRQGLSISVLGCGWLGFPLAKRLLTEGFSVKGSVTGNEKFQKLQNEGIIPFQIKILPEEVQGGLTSFLSEAKILIIDIPPGLRRNPHMDFTGKIDQIKKYIKNSPVKKVLFVSSTSVYLDKEDFPKYSEKDLPNGTSEAARQLISAEKLLLQNEYFNTTIIRFGGLIGPNRHPVMYLAGKTGIKNPAAPVNLIHQEDCIEIILHIINKNIWGDIFNGAYPGHPSKEEYYRIIAREKALPPPEFDHNSPSKGKIIFAEKLKEIGFKFRKNI